MPLSRMMLPRRAAASSCAGEWQVLSCPRCDSITLKLSSRESPSQSCSDFS